MGVNPYAASRVGMPCWKMVSASSSVRVTIMITSLAGMGLVAFTWGDNMFINFTRTPISMGWG
ncbi:hypothetical protein E2C01_039490 [Portunus trituberculatus]|uniref:Uncharacterized protein n=1 Tax=Portunus trituberculatus TaxID=210409 RepID=A0A5B7FJV1_PORTR|nr:hypothetical protein [Portunus trituberculatus]